MNYCLVYFTHKLILTFRFTEWLGFSSILFTAELFLCVNSLGVWGKKWLIFNIKGIKAYTHYDYKWTDLFWLDFYLTDCSYSKRWSSWPVCRENVKWSCGIFSWSLFLFCELWLMYIIFHQWFKIRFVEILIKCSSSLSFTQLTSYIILGEEKK